MTTLSKHELDVGLRRLGELAVARGIEINLVVIGGAPGTLFWISGRKSMVRIEDIARAALAYEALTVRDLIQDLLRDRPDWASIPRPVAVDENTLVVAAALLELLALRSGAEPAAWTRETGPAKEPIHPRAGSGHDAAHPCPRGSREPRTAPQTQRLRPR